MSRARDTANLGGTDLATQVELDAISVATAMKPHIRTGVLYPAVGGKGIDGSTTVTSFGTDFEITGYATLKYYYTDIKGSKPIKDPRIGAHFGSQRYKFKSLQLLEQETATHGSNVYSVDGREWLRAVGEYTQGNSDDGSYPTNSAFVVGFIEIVGYFSDANWIANNRTGTARGFVTSIDGGSDSSENTTFETTADSPLGSRYVDRGSLANLNLPTTHSTSLGIHTLKVKENAASDTPQQYGIELIAQDTTSTANKSKIQIPAQDVVSYGDKFTVAAAAHHYNPFAFAGDGTTAVAIGDTTSHGKVATGWTGSTSAYFDSTLDTATSLGLSAWETGGDFYRPVNGGRVVRWVDSSGNIKTSVNMMPPCATAITAGSDASLPTSHAWTTVYQPKIKSGAIDHSQAEVAKTFFAREFGNGSANGGTGATYADASMVSTVDDIAYVMDDGLTSLSGDNIKENGTQLYRNSGSETQCYITFIGTGIGKSGNTVGHNRIVAQNLPYGTHIFKQSIRSDNTNADWYIDGVQVRTDTAGTNNDSMELGNEFTFHQPKMPPIPENACILADYMLMADFVPQTAAGPLYISKGVRSVDCSRDIFADETDGDSFVLDLNPNPPKGFQLYGSGNADSDTSFKVRLPSFGTNYVARGYQMDTRHKLFIDDTDKDSLSTKDNTNTYHSYAHLTSDVELGVYNWGMNAVSGQAFNSGGIEIATPIHSSSHYQTFETPFLHELVGGDRNMEQTNLVVTPDGKTWDEVTRDTSYIGNVVVSCKPSADIGTSWENIIYTYQRGTYDSNIKLGIKNEYWVYAYDRFICLKDGSYTLLYQVKGNAPGNGGGASIKLNGTEIFSVDFNPESAWRGSGNISYQITAKRGDYVENTGYNVEGTSTASAHFAILKH